MISTKLAIFFLLFLTAVFSSATYAKWDHGENKENVDAKKSNSRETLDCVKGKCKTSLCNCCPGYGLSERGIFLKDYTCIECKCGGDYDCTFKGEVKYCKCPKEYIDYEGKCKKKFCDANLCFEGAVCSDKEESCSCDKGKIYYNKQCRDLDPFPQCNFTKFKKSCKCPNGTKINGGECKAISAFDRCSTNCGYGVCVEKRKKTCVCFGFAAFNSDGNCTLKKEICAGGELQKGLMKCKCDGQYTQADDGVTCRLKTCADKSVENICKEKGAVCQMDWKEKGYFCECKEDEVEDENEMCKNICSTWNCNDHGECEIRDGEAKCICQDQYEGEFCEIDKCFGLDCRGNGECEIVNKKAKCKCKEEYEGEYCQTHKCLRIDCNGHGKCKIVNAKATCECKDRYKGENCEIDKCSSRDCNGNGECKIVDKKVTCECKSGYTGENCEIETCLGRDCSGNGECKIMDNKAICECNERFEGENCETEISTNKPTSTSTLTPTSTPSTQSTITEMRPTTTIIGTTRPAKYDRCILKMINSECNKEHEYCDEGECKCEIGYKYSEDYEICEVDKCASCPEGSQCDPNSDEPCKCEYGYFYENKCIKYGKCDVGFSRCTQLCDMNSGKCKCESGFKIANDNVTCEINDENDSCDLNCSPGSCIKSSGREKCVCPQSTHKSVNGNCIDLCTISKGKPPKSLKCPKGLKCENDNEYGIRCKCEDPYEQAEDGIHCIRKEMCTEQKVIDECKTKFALCREVTFGKGYECYCDTKYIKIPRIGTEMNERCTDKCNIKRDECKEKNAICELNEEYNADCRCPVLLTRKDKFSTCNEIAKVSYSGEMSFFKSIYVVENKMSDLYKETKYIISFPKLKSDLKEAIQYVYGKNVKDVKIIQSLGCKVDEDLITCAIELQLEKEPMDLNALISPSYCYPLPKGFCIVKNLVVKRDKSLKIFNQTNPCILKDFFCDESTICKPDFKKRSFKCTCKEGFSDFGSFNPVSNEGNLVEKCLDIDECSSRIHSCPQNTTCINTYGSYECVCKNGFRRKTGNLDPKIHGCEVSVKVVTVTVPDKSDKKYVAITGGVLGSLLIIMFIVVVIIYRKLKKIIYDCDRCNEHGQKEASVETIRVETNENTYSEVNPASIYKSRKLTDKQMLNMNRMPRNKTVPRAQLSNDNNSSQMWPNRSSNSEMSHDLPDFTPQGYQRVQSTMQYSNKIYDMED